MYKELVFADEVSSSNAARLGSGACLADLSRWPQDRRGNPMLHLASIPGAWLAEHGVSGLAEEKVISIFVPYSRVSDDYIEELMVTGGKVVIHTPGAESVQAFAEAAPLKIITAVDNPAEDSEFNGVAKIGGKPAWLQEPADERDLKYVLQINSSRLNKALPTHKGILVGGIGYLLMGQKDGKLVGKFIVQTS